MSPAPKPAPREAAGSRADLLARDLAAAILDGRLPIGDDLPEEAVLAERHGAARAIVRTALRQLEVLGLIERSRGGAAQVIATDIRARYVIEGQAAEGGGYLGRTRLAAERPRRLVLDDELARLLDATAGAKWLHYTGMRLTADAAFGPLSCIDLWLATRAATLDLPAELTPASVEALLQVPIQEVEEEITAGTLTSAQARHLRARGGAACLMVLRRFRKRGGVTVAALRDIHPAERVGLTVRLQRPTA